MISNPVKMPSKTASLLLLVGLALIVALLGGSSNPRVPQLVGLRPLAALFLIPIIYYWQGPKSDQERTLLLLMLGTTLLMLFQLIPLPQGIWGLLPDRDIVADLDTTLELEPQWRPISWVPARGMNALASLIVPISALLLAISFRARNELLLQIVLGLALLNSLVVIVQIVSGNAESFYLYDPRSNGSDGLFGNENHAGVFSAIGLLVAARLGAQTDSRARPWHQIVYAVAALTIFLAVLIGGSRAGLAAGFGATVGAVLMLYLANRSANARRTRGKKLELSPRMFLAIAVVCLAGIAAVFFWLDRSPSFDGILNQSSLEDLRWQLNPILWEMISKNWLFGIGFGSFEEYYHIYEPTALLLPKYINLAHNDWAQLILEGGIVAVVLLAALLFWAFRQIASLFAQGNQTFFLIVFWAALLGIVGSASLIDYPLRTPIFQFVMVWLMLCLARDGQGQELRETPQVQPSRRSDRARRRANRG